MRRIAAGLATTMLVAGCGSIPMGKTSYYLPKAQTQFVIAQTLTCNDKNNALREVLTVTPTTTYSSDLKVDRIFFSPSIFTGTLEDPDVTVTFTNDGRLSGINATTTGQGLAVIKSAVEIAKTAGVVAASAEGLYDVKEACGVVGKYGTKDKDSGITTLDVGYATLVDYGDGPQMLKLSENANIAVEPDASSETVYRELRLHIPRLVFRVVVKAVNKVQAADWDPKPSGSSIELNSVAIASLQISGPVGDLNKVDVVWAGDIPIPLSGKTDRIYLPIPKAGIFGTEKFSLSLTDYGSVKSLEYSASGGGSDAAGAASALAGAVQGALAKPSDADQAAALQAQSNRIYQQHRLAICQANPEACPAQ